MSRKRSVALTLWALASAVAMGSEAAAQTPDQVAPGFTAVRTDDVPWPEGGGQVVLSGDPTKPGLYVVRVRFAPGRGTRPHTHDQDRYVTVLKGTWYVAIGPDANVYDPAKMMAMPAGSFIKHPAGGVHFDGARDEEVIVQIIGMGPVKTTQLT